jgi:hypothetical protein
MGSSGQFAECKHSAKSEESLPSVYTRQNVKNLCRVFTLGKEIIFTECQDLTLGNDNFFAERQVLDARQR